MGTVGARYGAGAGHDRPARGPTEDVVRAEVTATVEKGGWACSTPAP